MTNPNPTETAPRWVPAASKPGGLVFGDIVRRPPEMPRQGDQYVFIRHFHDCGIQWSRIANNYGDVFNHPHDEGDLLVRIDPPAQLPESTDKYDLGWTAAEMYLRGRAGSLKLSTNRMYDTQLAISYREAADCLRDNRPTPTEAADAPE